MGLLSRKNLRVRSGIAISIALLSASSAWARIGDLILIGGGPRGPEIIQRIGEAGGGERARIVVAPWATREPVASLDLLKTQFSSFKPRSLISAPYFPEEFDPEASAHCHGLLRFHQAGQIFDVAVKRKFLQELEQASVLYLTGGSQNRILKVVSEDPEIGEAILAFRNRGGVYVGTSAGTAAVPHLMMNGMVEKLADGTEKALVTPGLGLLPPGVFVDQHFVQRARFNRLRNLVIEDPSHLGIGISESTAAVIHDGRDLEVIGESQVLIYFRDLANPDGSIQELWLSRGAHFDLETRVVTRAAPPASRR